ncbi:MAG: hypothetical protein IJD37_02230 [Clostridia bacterium]|nr:hypothetical protein [Clostridia bacterium]
MKKIIKKFLLVCIVALALTALCSCDLIDELKEQRIDYIDVENQVLEFNGKQYKVLSNTYERNIAFDESKHCYVAEKEIPLLLIQDFGRSAYYAADKDLIRMGDTYYCTLDKYEHYADILKNGKLDRYRSYKYVVDEKKQQVFTEYYVLDEKTTGVIKNTLNNVVGKEVKDFDYAGVEFLHLDACDSENFLVEYDGIQLYKDGVNNKYGIRVFVDESDVIKEFSEGDSEVISKLFAMADFDTAYAKAYGKPFASTEEYY